MYCMWRMDVFVWRAILLIVIVIRWNVSFYLYLCCCRICKELNFTVTKQKTAKPFYISLKDTVIILTQRIHMYMYIKHFLCFQHCFYLPGIKARQSHQHKNQQIELFGFWFKIAIEQGNLISFQVDSCTRRVLWSDTNVDSWVVQIDNNRHSLLYIHNR